ncbi:MAG: hypothetical protein KF891_07655 [Rhizobacter sp.]|nr:hypothetical protein [Rhizobacter sp.]
MRWTHPASALTTVRTLVALLLGLTLSACAIQARYEAQERQRVAMSMYEQRCKTAGETIHRTVDNVEGIFVLKLRPQNINYGDQFALDDPYGSDFDGEAYLRSFLRGHYQGGKKPPPDGPPRLGYQFIEAVDPTDGVRYRYTGWIEEPWQKDHQRYLKGYLRFVMDKAPAPGAAPRYGVTYDDLSTHEEREHWIAGSSLKVIDLQTGEVIAERIGYMVDPAQGSRAAGRSPWLLAANYACPAFGREFKGPKLYYGHASLSQPYQTLDFVEKVLRPKQ